MRVILFGTAAFAVPTLAAIARSAHALVLCVTQPDRPQGRGLKDLPSPVKQAAERLSIPVIQPEHLTPELFSPYRADVGVLAAYGRFIRKPTLEYFPHGILGIHPSLLPKYRGAAPAAWALLNQEQETGMTIYQLDEGMDSGDILLQERTPITAADNGETLTQRLAELGARMIVQALDRVQAGQAERIPQDHRQATYAPKLDKAQAPIDWNQPAEVIHARVRALQPWPGSTCCWEGGTLKILSTALTQQTTTALPGTVVSTHHGLNVATKTTVLRITAVQPAGKRPMDAAAFLRGHAIAVNTRFS
jgi:methionyl-tRNA formyltransferase